MHLRISLRILEKTGHLYFGPTWRKPSFPPYLPAKSALISPEWGMYLPVRGGTYPDRGTPSQSRVEGERGRRHRSNSSSSGVRTLSLRPSPSHNITRYGGNLWPVRLQRPDGPSSLPAIAAGHSKPASRDGQNCVKPGGEIPPPKPRSQPKVRSRLWQGLSLTPLVHVHGTRRANSCLLVLERAVASFSRLLGGRAAREAGSIASQCPSPARRHLVRISCP
jgi:hypothetical protein